MKLIGITGKAGSGKTTAANFLSEKRYYVMSFATPLKLMSEYILDSFDMFPVVNKNEIIPGLNCTVRHLYQTLGTEWGRQCIHPDLWVLCAKHSIDRVTDFRKFKVLYDGIVFDDVRFSNEADFIRKEGGKIIHLVRENSIDDNHQSELGINPEGSDYIIVNNGNIKELKLKMSEFV